MGPGCCTNSVTRSSCSARTYRRQPPPTSRSSKPRRGPPARRRSPRRAASIAWRTAGTGALTAVARLTRLCGSSTISRIASRRRATSAPAGGGYRGCQSVIVGSETREIVIRPPSAVQRRVSSPSGSSCSKDRAAVPVQLEHREEPRDHDARAGSAPAMSSRKVRDPASRSIATTIAACSRMLTSGACRWSSPTCGISFGVIARMRERGEVVERQRPDEFGDGLAVLLVEPHRADVAGGPRRSSRVGEPRRHLFERAVLQQPGEQQVARLEQRDRLRRRRARPAAAGPRPSGRAGSRRRRGTRWPARAPRRRRARAGRR